MDHIITSETSFDPIVSYDIRPRRLIDTRTLELKYFAKEEPIPPYAILSHLWMHGEEYEYQEFVELHKKADRVCQVLEFSGIELKLAVIEFLVEMRSKYGLKHGFKSAFQKIRAACRQALNDNFRYIWIDTCCIDNRSRDEVAQNIRSMYAYYQNAEVCYAYLSDVDMHGGLSFALPSSGKLEYAFEDSQWFRRGWTLQELLAPRQVIFFDNKWRRIGTRDEYEEMIVIETGIPWEVVSGEWPIQDVSPAVRMSWARGRETTVPQDQAYCLMGLLGVDMDPNYDEDVGESFRRLGKALIDAYPEHKGALYSPENPFRELMANSIPPDMTPLDIFPRRFVNTFTLKLVQLEENSTPPSYAILSHRWMHEEEITFEEIQKDGEEIKSKFGYRKIQAACVQARRDGLCYLWVDTCCIQHGDQDDVKNNIRSMYAFYQNAEVCYAYLVDVYELSDFGNSEWFHRGWTLQELLAPRSLNFYDSGWNFIGSRVKLQKEIHAATGIPLKALSGEVSIRDVDLEERMAWSIERETTKPQDQVYCLLGLLGITMDPDYNEDIRTAVERLRKLFEQVHPGYSFWRIMKNALRSATSFHLLAPLDIHPRRLIDTLSLELTTFKEEDDTIPAYAILSHRWIHDEEVTFQEFKNPSPETKSKPGYQKIESACQQAHDQGLCYIWIDTCCIDQKGHDDVAWNLKSMYAFYQNSQICYAYLVDVEQWYLDFSRSEWFKRGWTLQELLAPSKVVFFDKHWTRFGSRDKNVDVLADVTRVPRAVLQGKQSLNDIHPLDRMSWAIGRRTTRPQDQIYCLFGLLGVSVEPDYDQDIRVLIEQLRKAFVQTYPKYSFWETMSDILRSATSSSLMARIDVRPRRLLDAKTLKLVEFKDHAVPPYAILSHRWVTGNEVTYHEFKNSLNESKLGYLKIHIACRQALHDGYHYIWIDTCCIQQGNHDDVVRNIRSMYAYYQNAEVCYAYMVDVEPDSSSIYFQIEKHTQFCRSEWFKRGWTLQELIAPRSVVFFDKNWGLIGSKNDLKNTICSIASIPQDVLSGKRPIQNIHPMERMSWSLGRKTTKPQDQAYCLLGLLGISMDPDYNENVDASFERLRKVFIESYPEYAEKLGSAGCFWSVLQEARLNILLSLAGGMFPVENQYAFS